MNKDVQNSVICISFEKEFGQSHWNIALDLFQKKRFDKGLNLFWHSDVFLS